MMKPAPDPHCRRRFPAEVISYAVWLHSVFNLSFRDVELLLTERGVPASYTCRSKTGPPKVAPALTAASPNRRVRPPGSP
jgi:transposase-like protein